MRCNDDKDEATDAKHTRQAAADQGLRSVWATFYLAQEVGEGVE